MVTQAASPEPVFPDITGSQFVGLEREGGLRLTLLDPYRGRIPRSGFIFRGVIDRTIHTSAPGNPSINDLHATTGSLGLRMPLRSSARPPELSLQLSSTPSEGAIHEKSSRLEYQGSLIRGSARLNWPVWGGARCYAGADLTKFGAAGSSSIFEGIFDIFSSTPGCDITREVRRVTAGLVTPLSQALTVEIASAHEDSPGRLVLQDPGDASRLVLPLEDRGWEWVAAISYALRPGATAYAYTSSGHFQATGTVEREQDRPIGRASTLRDERGHGVGCLLSTGGRTFLGLHYEDFRHQGQTSGSVPHPEDAGLPVLLGSDLSYSLRYDTRKREWGFHWQRDFSAFRAVRLSYRWIELPSVLDAVYAVHVLLFSQGSSATQDSRSLRAHFLEARYTLPVHSLESEIEISQIIPVSNQGSPLPGPAAGTRRTFGGLTLGWTLRYPF